MASISDILNKGMARLSALAEKKQAVKEGKPLRLKTAVNNLERTQRALEKGREQYLKAIIENRDEILGKDIPATQVKEGRLIADKYTKEAREILNAGWKRKAILEFELLVCEIKEMVVEADIDTVIYAAECYDDFVEGLKDYTLEIVTQGAKIDPEKVKHLWNICMPEKNVKALSRSSTPFSAIDVFRYDAVRALNEATEPEQIQPIINKFVNEINTRFKTWGLDFQVPANHN